MKQTVFFSMLFFVSALCVAQDKMPILFLSPDASFKADCSTNNSSKNKSQVEQYCKNYVQEVKTKYSSILNPVSFRLLEAVLWKSLSFNRCIEQSVANAKIKAIADEVKSIPSEETLVFLSHFGFEPSFAVNEKLLRTEDEINKLLEGATDEYLLMMKRSLPYIHAEASFLVAKSLAKNKENCQLVCNLTEQTKQFFSDRVITKEIMELQSSCKCFENETDNSN